MKTLWRITLLLAMPPVMFWVVVSGITKGLYAGFREGRYEIAREIGSFRAMWRNADRTVAEIKRGWKAGRTFARLKRDCLKVRP